MGIARGHSIAAVAVLALVGAPVAQQEVDGQRVTELIEELREGTTPELTSAELIAIGRHSTEITRMAIDGLSDATGRDFPPESLPFVVRVAGALGPFERKEEGVREIVDSIERRLHEVGAGVRESILQEILRARALISVDAHAPIEDLVLHLRHESSYARELAASLIGEYGARARVALPDLGEMLRIMHPLVKKVEEVRFSSRGTLKPRAHLVPYDRAVQTSAARAMVEIAPDDEMTRAAYAVLLAGGRDEERRFAVEAIVRLGPKGIVTAQGLLESLRGDDLVLIREVVTALGMLGPLATDAIAQLEEFTQHDDRQLAERARAALRRIPDPASSMMGPRGRETVEELTEKLRIVDLIKQLEDPNTEARAREELRTTEQAVPFLLQVINQAVEDEDPGVVPIRCLEIMAEIGPRATEAIPDLLSAVKTPDTDFAQAVIETLGSVVPHAAPEDLSFIENDLVRRAWVIGQIEGDAAKRKELCTDTVNALARMHVNPRGETSSLITMLLTDRNPFRRAYAAELLGSRGEDVDSVLPALREALALRHPDGVNYTHHAIRENFRARGGQPMIRIAVARSILELEPGELATNEAIAFVLLRQGTPEERIAATIRLSRNPGEKPLVVVAGLRNCLTASHPQVVQEAITALGIMGPVARKAGPDLQKLTEHVDSQIAERAKAALRQIRGG